MGIQLEEWICKGVGRWKIKSEFELTLTPGAKAPSKTASAEDTPPSPESLPAIEEVQSNQSAIELAMEHSSEFESSHSTNGLFGSTWPAFPPNNTATWPMIRSAALHSKLFSFFLVQQDWIF